MNVQADTRPTLRSNNPWGMFSSMEGKPVGENTWTDVRFEGQRQHCFSSSNDSRLMTPFHLGNVEAYGTGHLYWIARLYNVNDSLIENCHFHHAGHYAEYTHDGRQISMGKREGHALYFNLFGNLAIVKTRFEELLGQGVQIVWRKHETKIEEDPEGHIQIKDCTFRDCSRDPGDRAAYPLSIFDTFGHDVIVRRTNIWSTDATPRWWNTRTQEECQSRGAALFQGGAEKTLDIKHLNVQLIDPDRPGVKIDGFGKIKWDGGHLVSEGRNRPLRVDINTNTATNIDITNLRGNYEVMINGVRTNL